MRAGVDPSASEFAATRRKPDGLVTLRILLSLRDAPAAACQPFAELRKAGDQHGRVSLAADADHRAFPALVLDVPFNFPLPVFWNEEGQNLLPEPDLRHTKIDWPTVHLSFQDVLP
jgi:hypothetical protein